MTAIELRAILDQEISFIKEDDTLMKKTVAYIRRLREKAAAKAEEDREPTKEEILAAIREGLQAIKDEREGKDVTGQFCTLEELFNE